jgi:hypothetical protein
MTTGYFSSVVQEISEHVKAFIACPGAQVYWWLRRLGCLTEDVNRLIRHCFTLSQQQKVTASKYLKDLGHAVVERTDGDDIMQASSSEGIYDLTLGLSDKERWSLGSRGHDAAAIGTQEASKTQGSQPGAQQTSPAEGTVIEPATVCVCVTETPVGVGHLQY